MNSQREFPKPNAVTACATQNDIFVSGSLFNVLGGKGPETWPFFMG